MMKVVDGVLLFFFVLISVAAPLLDSQTALPDNAYPTILQHLRGFYLRASGDYMFAETLPFFVGIIWVQLLFQWPLAVACAYGIVARKPWFGIACLVYGASLLTSMGAALGELHLSNRAPDRLFKIYYPFLGFSVLAMVRGLFGLSGNGITMEKKRA